MKKALNRVQLFVYRHLYLPNWTRGYSYKDYSDNKDPISVRAEIEWNSAKIREEKWKDLGFEVEVRPFRRGGYMTDRPTYSVDVSPTKKQLDKRGIEVNSIKKRSGDLEVVINKLMEKFALGWSFDVQNTGSIIQPEYELFHNNKLLSQYILLRKSDKSPIEVLNKLGYKSLIEQDVEEQAKWCLSKERIQKNLGYWGSWFKGIGSDLLLSENH